MDCIEESNIPEDFIFYEQWLEAKIEEKSMEIEVLQFTQDFKQFEIEILQACNEDFDSINQLEDEIWLKISDPGDPERTYSVDAIEIISTEADFNFETFKKEKMRGFDTGISTIFRPYKFIGLISIPKKMLTICIHAQI